MVKTTNLPRKGKLMLTHALLLATLFSCSKKDYQDTLSVDGDQIAASENLALANSANLIFTENFEGSSAFSTYVNKQIETSYGLTLANSPVFEGKKSGRFELRDSDPMNNNGTRAEVSFPEQSGLNRWYAFSVYFPASDYKHDSEDELINQWHQGGGVTPSITLGTKEDKYRLIVKESPTAKQTFDLGKIAKDKWNTFVFHINHSSKSDGLIEVWLNGQKVVNRNGVNMYELSSGKYYSPKWKLGVYKSAWNNSNTTTTSKRVLYYDDVRIGNEKASYADMTSGGGSSTPAPTPAPTPTEPTPAPAPTTPAPAPTTPSNSPITGLVLVSAHTEKDVMTITNGATISLSKLKLSNNKLNIRANTGSSLGSVKFELSGKQSKSYIDSAIPFALHGDSGSGNFYYGNWNPPALGTYTLKATPYSGSKGTGTAGTPYSVTFTFVK